MSVTYLERRNTRSGHEVLRNSGVVICYEQGGQFGKAVARQLLHSCPFCEEQVFTFAS
ncbi:MAG: hypothetical protein NTX29_01175 [Actinobacteria bacterium]|nr:hypothetical protein [Actinomycetota bacterium]